MAKLREKFSLLDWLQYLGLLNLAVIIGIYGIAIYSLKFAIFYFVFFHLGGIFILAYSMCTHCPYYGTSCPFLLYGKVIRYLFKFRKGGLNLTDHVLYSFFILVFLFFPQPWLIKNKLLFISFWVSLLILKISLYLKVCSKCKNFSCPVNGVKIKEKIKKTLLKANRMKLK